MALRRIAYGAAALSAARIFQLAAAFVAVPFLARVLSPADFGLVALAMSVVMFTTYIGDAGLGRSLLRVSADDHVAWSTAHWAVIALTCGLGLFILALAWPAAAFFAEPRLAPIMAALALVPVLLGVIEIPAAALLQQERFRWLAAAEFLSALVGVAVALVLAFDGAGAWALVWQNLSMRIAKIAITLAGAGFRPRFAFSFARLSEHLRFAGHTAGWSVMTFVSRQADTLVIGKFLGAATLGLYNIAYRVMQLPVSIVGGAVHNALYPRLVRLRNDHAALRELVFAASMAQAALVFPPLAAIAAASDAFFTLLLSERWRGADLLFTLLAPAAAIQTVLALNGSLLQAVGRTGARLRMTVEFALLWSLAALALAQVSAAAVAAGCSAATLLYLPRQLQLYLYPIGARRRAFAAALAAPTLAALAIFALHRLAFAGLGAWPQAGLAAAETLAAYAALLLLGRRTLAARLAQVRALLADGPAPTGA